MGFLSILSNIIFNSYIFSSLGEFLMGSLFSFVIVWYITKICKTANNSATLPEEQEVDASKANEGKTTQSITASECPVISIEGKEEPMLLTGTSEVKLIAGKDVPLLIRGIPEKEEVKSVEGNETPWMLTNVPLPVEGDASLSTISEECPVRSIDGKDEPLTISGVIVKEEVDIKALISKRLHPDNLKMLKTVLEIQSSFKKIKHVEFHGDFILYHYMIDKLLKENTEPTVLFGKVNNFFIDFSKLKMEVGDVSSRPILQDSVYLDMALQRIKLLESVIPRISASNNIKNKLYIEKLADINHKITLWQIFKEKWHPILSAHFSEWEKNYPNNAYAIITKARENIRRGDAFWSKLDAEGLPQFNEYCKFSFKANRSTAVANNKLNQFTAFVNDMLIQFEKVRQEQTLSLCFLIKRTEVTSASSIPDMPIPIISKDNIDKIDPRIKNIIGIPKDLEEFPCMLQGSDSMGLLGRDLELKEVVDALLEIIQNI